MRRAFCHFSVTVPGPFPPVSATSQRTGTLGDVTGGVSGAAPGRATARAALAKAGAPASGPAVAAGALVASPKGVRMVFGWVECVPVFFICICRCIERATSSRVGDSGVLGRRGRDAQDVFMAIYEVREKKNTREQTLTLRGVFSRHMAAPTPTPTTRRARAGARAGARLEGRARPSASSSIATLLRRLTDPADTRAALAMALLILIGEALLTGLIIKRVPCECRGGAGEWDSCLLCTQDALPCSLSRDNPAASCNLTHPPPHTPSPPFADTEIDWSTYMEQLTAIDKVWVGVGTDAQRERRVRLPPLLRPLSLFSIPSIPNPPFSFSHRANATTPASAGPRARSSTPPATSGCTGACGR